MNLNMFTTLAEPNRLYIVELLRNGPKSVNEIATRLKLNQPQTSKHLKVLANAGIVAATPVANQRLYQLKPEPFSKLHTWLEKYQHIWDKRFDRLDNFLKKAR